MNWMCICFAPSMNMRKPTTVQCKIGIQHFAGKPTCRIDHKLCKLKISFANLELHILADGEDVGLRV